MSNSVITSTTVVDADGVAWANATWVAQLPRPFSNQPGATVSGVAVPTTVTGTLDGSGVMTATLTDTSSLDQAGLQWTIIFQPTANVPAQSITLPVIGATPNLTAAFSNLPGLRFPAGPKAYGYNDVEVKTPLAPGSSYFNVATGLRVYNGAAWVANYVPPAVFLPSLATAPTGAGTTGDWAFSRDGVLSFCKAGTWEAVATAT